VGVLCRCATGADDVGALAGLRVAIGGDGSGTQPAIFVVAPDAPAIQQLLRAPDVRLMDFRRAEAWERRFPAFTLLKLPAGAIDLAQQLPPQDVHLLGLTASLGASSDLHPVIVDLLLGAAREVHGGGSVLWRPGQFPNGLAREVPLDIDAERFYKSGPCCSATCRCGWPCGWSARCSSCCRCWPLACR
jgi:hypothetical protein